MTSLVQLSQVLVSIVLKLELFSLKKCDYELVRMFIIRLPFYLRGAKRGLHSEEIW